MSEEGTPGGGLALWVGLGAAIAVAVLGRAALPWALALAAGAAIWVLLQRRRAGRPDAEREASLRARWLELPGAEPAGPRAIDVHDGMQPIRIHLEHRRLAHRDEGPRATVTTGIGEAPVAFRVWPAGGERPPMEPGGGPVGGAPVERAATLEPRLAGRLSAEASDEELAGQMLSGEALAALLVVAREAEGSFAGLVYDGERLAIHLRGPMAADPDRATRIARTLWRPFG